MGCTRVLIICREFQGIQSIINQNDIILCHFISIPFRKSIIPHPLRKYVSFYCGESHTARTIRTWRQKAGEAGEGYAKYTRRSAACDANVHFMHPEFLRTGKISSDLYYVCAISGRTHTHTYVHSAPTCAQMRMRVKKGSYKIVRLPLS